MKEFIDYIPLFTALIAAFVSCFTYYLGKRHEKKIELRRLKEAQYIDFLSSLAKAKSTTEDNELKKMNIELSAKIQTIYLVGNKEVQIKLQSFLNSMIEKANVSKSQDELYGELITEMKLDLYGKKHFFTCKNSNSLEKINFTIF